MEKSVKNSSQLTEKQRQTVDQIILTMGARIYHLTEIMTDPEEYAKKYLKVHSSKQTLALSYMLLKLVPNSKTFFPGEVNKQLAMAFAKDADEYLQGPALSRILSKLKEEGILLNIKGKKHIKHNIGGILVKEHKGGEYGSSKRVGQYSVYKLTSDVEELLNVLSNPVALQIIHSRLKSSGFLRKFLKLLFVNLTYLLSKDDEKTQTSFLNGFYMTRPLRMDDSSLNKSDLQRYVTYFKSIDKKQLDRLAEEFANNMMEDNLSNNLYLLSALPSADPDTDFN